MATKHRAISQDILRSNQAFLSQFAGMTACLCFCDDIHQKKDDYPVTEAVKKISKSQHVTKYLKNVDIYFCYGMLSKPLDAFNMEYP